MAFTLQGPLESAVDLFMGTLYPLIQDPAHTPLHDWNRKRFLYLLQCVPKWSTLPFSIGNFTYMGGVKSVHWNYARYQHPAPCSNC